MPGKDEDLKFEVFWNQKLLIKILETFWVADSLCFEKIQLYPQILRKTEKQSKI